MSQSTLSAGAVFHEHYQIIRAIRSGGMGEVYRAIDKRTGLAVAIKRMLVEAYGDGADESALYQAARFEEECKLLQNLRVPGVPTFVDSFLDGDRRVIVMEFIEGVDLEKQVMDQIGLAGADLPALQAVEYTIQVAKILEYLHAHRPRPIIHRDVKPANIIVRHQDNAIYLVDFGLAREVGGSASTKTAVGTVGYAPLEQYRGRPTTRTDQYSLGVTLHFMLSGQQPLPLQIEPLDKIKKDLPHELCWVVRKATQQEQEDRFDSVYDFRRELEKLVPALQQHQKNQELQDQAKDRISLMGPTEELTQEERPTQRVKIEGIHKEAEDPMKDFGLYHPLQNTISLQSDFQRQAMAAENQQRKGSVDLDRHDPGKTHKMILTVSIILLVAGICALYFLNGQQQRQIATSVAGPRYKVVEAHGFYRSSGKVGLNREKMGTLEYLLSFPHPANDGYLATLPKATRRLTFSNLPENNPVPFFVATLDEHGIVVTSKWLQADKGGWREAPTAYRKVHVDFNSPLAAPPFGAQVKTTAALDCTKASYAVIFLLPQPAPESLIFYEVGSL
ncbi:serine/threonine protein kinase [bacterium]|nr:serine/threonine protein kinase [bacterium]